MSSPSERVISLYQRFALGWDRERERSLLEKAWLDRFLALLPLNPSILAGAGIVLLVEGQPLCLRSWHQSPQEFRCLEMLTAPPDLPSPFGCTLIEPHAKEPRHQPDHSHANPKCRRSSSDGGSNQFRCRRSLASIPRSRLPHVRRNTSSFMRPSFKQRTSAPEIRLGGGSVF
jgi:hypothetical protein